MADKDDIIEAYAAGSLPVLLADRLRGHRTDEFGASFRSELVTLHNQQSIDFLKTVEAIDTSAIKQHEFFTILHAVSKIIPELEADVPAMLRAVSALVAKAGEDLMSGTPNIAFREWAEKDDRASLTLAEVDPADPAGASFIFLALQAMAKNQPEAAFRTALEYLAGPHQPARWSAAKALGMIELETAEACRQAVEALSAASIVADDNGLGHILVAACEIARKHADAEDAVSALLEEAAPRTGESAVHQVALELMFHASKFSTGLVRQLTTIVQKVKPASRGTLDNIDSAAAAMLRSGRVEEALALISPLIVEHEELASLEALDSFSHALLEIAPDQLASVITNWLIADETILGHAALSLVGNHFGNAPLVLQVDRVALGLSEPQAFLLAHRAIGFLFLHAITAASIVLGLLRRTGGEARDAMGEILFDPLLINYSGELADWLRERADDAADPAQSLVIDLLARLEKYIAGLRQAGRIKELRPSERERLIETHRQHEAIRQAHKRAEKKSIFMSIVSRSVLLYGNRAISYVIAPDGQKHRHEMKMQQISHSFEAPRLDILEPFDLDYRLRRFRAMRLVR